MREGCYLCHSQMIRALRFETQRYGHFLDRERVGLRPPVPVGLQAHRTRLARVGGKYSDDWQRVHLT